MKVAVVVFPYHPAIQTNRLPVPRPRSLCYYWPGFTLGDKSFSETQLKQALSHEWTTEDANGPLMRKLLCFCCKTEIRRIISARIWSKVSKISSQVKTNDLKSSNSSRQKKTNMILVPHISYTRQKKVSSLSAFVIFFEFLTHNAAVFSGVHNLSMYLHN